MMDFMSDILSDGHSFRTLNLVHAYAQQCSALPEGRPKPTPL